MIFKSWVWIRYVKLQIDFAYVCILFMTMNEMRINSKYIRKEMSYISVLIEKNAVLNLYYNATKYILLSKYSYISDLYFKRNTRDVWHTFSLRWFFQKCCYPCLKVLCLLKLWTSSDTEPSTSPLKCTILLVPDRIFQKTLFQSPNAGFNIFFRNYSKSTWWEVSHLFVSQEPAAVWQIFRGVVMCHWTIADVK